MKKLILAIALVFMAAPAWAQWAIETKDNEVDSLEKVVVSKTETVVTERLSKAQLDREITTLKKEKTRLQARIAEIDGRVLLLEGTVVPMIESSSVKLKPVEVEEEIGVEVKQ